VSPDHNLYLKDILVASKRILSYTQGLNRSGLENDKQALDAVLFNLMVIGEAVKNIPDTLRTQHPEVPWRQIGRFRDVVVPHYFDLDLEIIWDIIQTKLPPLVEQL
jgi:uncharacterized protein with HEPN domain